MGYTTVVAGTTITASWANANVRDQVVTPFASTGARDSAIVSPVTGMVSYIASTDTAEGLVTRTTGGVWRPPWNLQWGRVAFTSITADSASTTGTVADVSTLAVTWTAIANRRYRITLLANAIGSADTDILGLYITTSGNTVLDSSFQVAGQTNKWVRHVCIAEVTPGAGSVTYKARHNMNGGTGTSIVKASATAPGQIIVDDVGPSGAPA